MYDVAKEYRSSARLNLLTLGLDMVQFWHRKAEIDSRTLHLNEAGPGLVGWLQDLLFKYKRFQTRDLPPFDKWRVQQELSQCIDDL